MKKPTPKKPMPMKPGKMKMRFGKPVAKAAGGGVIGTTLAGGASSGSMGASRAMPMPAVRPGAMRPRNPGSMPNMPKVSNGRPPAPRTGGGNATFQPAMRDGGAVPPNGGRRGGGVMGVPVLGRSVGPANGGRRGGGIQGKPVFGRPSAPANGGPRGGGIQGKPKAGR